MPESAHAELEQAAKPPADPYQDATREELLEEIQKLREQVAELTKECDYLRSLEERIQMLEKEVECLSKSCMSSKMIAEIKMTRFYTGLPTFVVFTSLFAYLQGKASQMRMWRGPKAEECRSKSNGKGIGGTKRWTKVGPCG